MSWRTIIISRRCKLDLKMGYLVIRGEQTNRVFLNEIGILIIENPAVSLTGYLLDALIDRKVKIIFCDKQRNPKSELVAYHDAYDDSRKIREQIKWENPVKENIWTAIVSDKILKQSEVLAENDHERESGMLREYAQNVLPGDSSNREGHAAKVYFNALFGMSFSRQDESPINAALNYGYGIILSAFNREIALNGYLTQIGLFHDNVYNHFNLGCDLMESFRPLIDQRVLSIMSTKDEWTSFSTEDKRVIVQIINDTVKIDDCNQTVLNAIKIYVKSVFNAINDNNPLLIKQYTKMVQ